MAIINCPSCQARISELAIECPKCGLKVQEFIKRKEEEDKISKMQSKADEYIRLEKPKEALDILYEFKNYLNESESKIVNSKIIKMKELDRKQQLSKLIELAKESYNKKNFSKAISFSEKVLLQNPENEECTIILEKSKEKSEIYKNKLLKTGIYTSISAVVLILIVIIIFNQIKISSATQSYKLGNLDEARDELLNCIPILDFGKSDLIDEINNFEFDKLISEIIEAVNSSNFSKSIKLSQQILEIAKGNNIAKLNGLVNALNEGNKFKTIKRRASESKARIYATDYWEKGLNYDKLAIEYFNSKNFNEAATEWGFGHTSMLTAIQAAQRKEDEIRNEKRMYAEQQKRIKEEARIQSEKRNQEEELRINKELIRKYKNQISSYSKNCFAYKEALAYEKNGNYNRAANFYELACRYQSTIKFNGKLSLLSGWSLDGSYSNYHSFAGSRNSIVYLFVDNSDERLNYQIKFPKGREVSISDGYSVDLDDAGTYKLEVFDKESSRYVIHLEIYNGK